MNCASLSPISTACYPGILKHRCSSLDAHELLEGIGSTESLHIFISNRAGSAKIGSTGQLVHGYEAKIVDDNVD